MDLYWNFSINLRSYYCGSKHNFKIQINTEISIENEVKVLLARSCFTIQIPVLISGGFGYLKGKFLLYRIY